MRQLVIETDDGGPGQAFPIRRAQTTLGRRPHNDIVIEDRMVSGQHAVLTLSGHDLVVEDLNSTNGTFVNGVRIKRHQLSPEDLLEVGNCHLRYRSDGLAEPSFSYEKTTVLPSSRSSFGPDSASDAYTVPSVLPKQLALVQFIGGERSGHEMLLTKVVTAVGKQGAHAVAICRRPSGFVLTQVAGSHGLQVNGHEMHEAELALKHDDVIEFQGTKLRFVSP
jgi:pSer/pThr/pTyr-binding forkhead associated (FHA) protein